MTKEKTGAAAHPSPVPIDNLPAIKNLAPIQNALLASQAITTRGKEVSTPILQSFKEAKLNELSDIQLSELGAKLLNVQERCAKGKEKQNSGRKPITQAFDAIRSLFTAEENALGEIEMACAKYRGLINAEIKRRQDEKSKSATAKMDVMNEEIDYRAHFTAHLNKSLAAYIASMKNKSRAKINQSSDLLRVEADLKKWAPSLKPDVVNGWAAEFKFELFHLKEKPSFDVPLSDMENTYLSEMLPEKAFLLQEVALRIGGVATGPIPLIGEQEVKKEEQQVQQAIEVQAASEKINASFSIQSAAPSPLPIIDNVPKKYIPSSHEHWTRLLTWYVESEMPHLTASELANKFSFILTKANNVLNATNTLITGVPTEDNFNATARRPGRPKKEKVA